MSPFEITGWILVIVVLTMLVAYFVPRRKREAPRIITPEGRLTFPTLKRPVGKHPALGAPYHSQFGKRVVPPTKKPVVVLSSRDIESVNIKRKLRGYPSLNRAGVKNAISSAGANAVQLPTTNDWLLYLMLWETFSADHKSPTCGGTGGFVIDPNLPYNGHGGEFAGAGASGSWTDAPLDVQNAAAGISVGASAAYMEQNFVTDKSDPANVPDEIDARYKPGDTVGGYMSASDPSTVREPDLSPVSNSGSSYSSSSSDSSSSSSSSDSSSSSSSSDSGSSGGDSGGGGGGGGGD